jgi:hypothetical protein
MSNPAYSFLESYRAIENDDITHQVFGDKFKGSFTLDKIERKEFMKIYTETIKQNIELTVIERVKEYGPILVDIDLKQLISVQETSEKRLYSKYQLVTLCEIYNAIIKDLIGEYKNIFVFEKQEPTIKNNEFKDGFHLIIPDVCFNKNVRHYIRDEAVRACKQINLFDGYSNSIDDIIDKAVVSSNGWFLYGSSKPGCKPYKLTMEYNGFTNEFNNNPTHSTEDIIKYFSIQSYNYSKKNQTELGSITYK